MHCVNCNIFIQLEQNAKSDGKLLILQRFLFAAVFNRISGAHTFIYIYMDAEIRSLSVTLDAVKLNTMNLCKRDSRRHQSEMCANMEKSVCVWGKHEPKQTMHSDENGRTDARSVVRSHKSGVDGKIGKKITVRLH